MALELDTTTPRSGPSKPGASLSISGLSRRKLKARDRMFFTEQLSLMLETGANLYKALQTLRDQTANPAMTEVIDALLDDVSGGRPFSQALAKHPTIFSENYVNLVASSESGAFLHKVLHELKAMEEKRDELKRSLFSALSYPVFLLVFSVAVVFFVLLVVFPKFGDLFASIHDQLPVTTQALMSLSTLLIDYWTYGLIAAGSITAMLVYWLSTPAGEDTVDTLLLNLPGIKNICAELYLIQTLRVISLSLGNGVPLLETLQACRNVINNKIYRQFLANVESGVREGAGMAGGFERAAFIPAVAKAMISTAEESGQIATVAWRIADYYEQQLTRRLNVISKMAEPIMLLVMGAVVGLLVSSLILPIFKLSRAVS